MNVINPAKLDWINTEGGKKEGLVSIKSASGDI
jgi:hypothetical protein